ncbi:hypothetical protein U1Q18_037833 [Sarracenia purpurea var. burkii]
MQAPKKSVSFLSSGFELEARYCLRSIYYGSWDSVCERCMKVSQDTGVHLGVEPSGDDVEKRKSVCGAEGSSEIDSVDNGGDDDQAMSNRGDVKESGKVGRKGETKEGIFLNRRYFHENGVVWVQMFPSPEERALKQMTSRSILSLEGRIYKART